MLDVLQQSLQPAYGLLIPLIECPVFDPLSANQAGLGQEAEVFAHTGLGDSQLLGYEEATHPILHQVTIHLWWKMLPWIF